MIPELLGPYEWDDTPSRFSGLAAIAQGRGPEHPRTKNMALMVAYKRAAAGFACEHLAVWNVRVGCCVRPRGHEGAHRKIKLSLADSRAVLAGMRRVVEPDPIPEVDA